MHMSWNGIGYELHRQGNGKYEPVRLTSSSKPPSPSHFSIFGATTSALSWLRVTCRVHSRIPRQYLQKKRFSPGASQLPLEPTIFI